MEDHIVDFVSRICLISVWMGKFPEYFSAWLKSVENNQEIDFLLITDQNINFKISNLKIKRLTLNEVKNKIENSLKMKIELSNSYKLCDYKPVYGKVFSRWLEGYNYWGYCDVDVIFGRLYYFLKDILNKYDRIFYSGHL